MENNLEQQNNIDTPEQQKHKLLQGINQLASKEKNPTKKQLIPKLWAKIVNDFQAETGFSLKKMQKKIISTWNTVLEETISQMPENQMKTLLPMFTKWNKKRGWLFNFLKKELNKFNKKADNDKIKADNERQTNILNSTEKQANSGTTAITKQKEKVSAEITTLKKQIAKAEASKTEAIQTHNIKLENPENLQTEAQQKDFATNKLWYSDEQFEAVKTKFNGSSYEQAGLKFGQVFSFLQTKQQLTEKNVQENAFFDDFWPIERDLELPNPSFQRPLNEPIEPAENLQNLTTAQSAQIIFI